MNFKLTEKVWKGGTAQNIYLCSTPIVALNHIALHRKYTVLIKAWVRITHGGTSNPATYDPPFALGRGFHGE